MIEKQEKCLSRIRRLSRSLCGQSKQEVGKGFADVVYLPKRTEDKGYPALVVELKWNHSAQGAIRQIQEKQYASWIEGYTGEILLVGINYDREEKTHSCVIERHKKSRP